jgi:hypothetical protein
VEPPVYRAFALLAFAATLVVGAPLGVAMLAWLYLGLPAVPAPLVLLHAHAQILGFFATLIPGVAPHLLARFTGCSLQRERIHAWLVAGLGGALALRLVAAAAALPWADLGAATIQTLAFAVFGLHVWRALALPPLALVRRHLTLATSWLVAAGLGEAAVRGHAVAAGLAFPDVGLLRAVHAMALVGGVLGWVLGVLLRAGPMFVADWRIPRALGAAVPFALAGGASLAGRASARTVPR